MSGSSAAPGFSIGSGSPTPWSRISILQPEHGFRTNVYAYAKTTLKKGDRLDGIGGYACYGLIENCPEPAMHPGLPICLAHDLVLERRIEKDEPIMLADGAYDSDRFDFALYRRALDVAPASNQVKMISPPAASS